MNKKLVFLVILFLIIGGLFYFLFIWQIPEEPRQEISQGPTLFAKEDYKIEEREDGNDNLIGISNNTSWKNALKVCNNLNIAGYDDWRLPNIMEIINATNKNGSKILEWKSGLSGYYFSSTLANNGVWSAGNGYNAGRVQVLSKDSSHYVQCVRKTE